MGKADYFAPGQFNRICERTGFKIKSGQSQKEWTNAIVRKESWEARQPQDLIRSRPDNQIIPDPRTEGAAGTETFIDQSTLVYHQDFTQSSLALAAAVGPVISDFDRTGLGAYFDSAGVMQFAATDTPRLASHLYNGTSWVNKGYLAERDSRNELLQSEDLTTTWTIPGANTTITANAGVALDGTTTADDVLHGDSAETLQITDITSDRPYTVSAFVKQGSTGAHDWVRIAFFDDTAGTDGVEAWFNISTGAVGTAQALGSGTYTAGSAKIRNLGNGGWYRIEATGKIGAAAFVRVEIINTTADAVTTAETTNSVFWWGIQLEDGPPGAELGQTSYATSYMKTAGSTTSRSQDRLFEDDDLSWYPKDLGSTVCEVEIENDNIETPTAENLILRTVWALIRQGLGEETITDDCITDDVFYFSIDDGDVISLGYPFVQFTDFFTAAQDVRGTTELDDGVIHQVGASWDWQKKRVYVGDTKENELVATALINNSAATKFSIGTWWTRSSLDGHIRSLKIYDSDVFV